MPMRTLPFVQGSQVDGEHECILLSCSNRASHYLTDINAPGGRAWVCDEHMVALDRERNRSDSPALLAAGLIFLLLVACGGVAESSNDNPTTVAPTATTVLPAVRVDAGCMLCVGGVLWDVCPATPVQSPDAESCATCGGRCVSD